MTLSELIAALKSMPPEKVVRHGFGRPMSYRGDYAQLAFDPVENAIVGEMLVHAESALGRMFIGYKGGEFTMGEWTDCYIEEHGRCRGNAIGHTLMQYWSEE